MGAFLNEHSNEVMILSVVAMVLATLIVIVPQLLRTHNRAQEMRHAERLRSIENGLPVPPPDDRLKAAGRTAVLVPTISVIVAGTVTCFLHAYKAEKLDNMLAVTISVWSVAGIVSLAAITGGVALVGRLAQLDAGEIEEQEHVRP